MSLISYNVFL
jgi:hypothetical protein